VSISVAELVKILKDLLAQGQVLQEQVAAGAQEIAHGGDEEVKHVVGSVIGAGL